MKTTLFSLLAAMTLSGVASANTMTLYTDPATGQVFTQNAEGRVALESSTANESAAPVKNQITIIDQKSPDFLLGKQTHINMKFIPEDAPDMWLKAGVRIQGTYENLFTDYNGVKTNTDINDAYLRRVRFEVAAGFGKHASFVMDVRNDKSNHGIENTEGVFNVGDAYVKIKKPFDTSLVNFKLYRAKIDVSRTETVKSARVIAYDRPYVADIAAQYISFNRRGANVQMYGDWKKKIHYQIAAGSASSPTKILDAAGDKASSDAIDIDEQTFFYGGKIRLSPFDGWEETKRTETYFGKGKHLSVGASYWSVPTLKGTNSNTAINPDGAAFDLNRELINIEASAHYYGFFVQAEYFKFKDAVNDWAADTIETGDSNGWYVTSEYVMPDLGYVAPFVRYESHDRYENTDDTTVTSALAGVNWYLRGNTTKVGVIYQQDHFDKNAARNEDAAGNSFEKDVRIIRVTSQWFF
jgi:hypothetical protein